MARSMCGQWERLGSVSFNTPLCLFVSNVQEKRRWETYDDGKGKQRDLGRLKKALGKYIGITDVGGER